METKRVFPYFHCSSYQENGAGNTWILSMDIPSSDSFRICPGFKGVFGGSGQDLMSNDKIQKMIMRLTGKNNSDIVVVYLGTATYDSPEACYNQTHGFTDAGATVIPFKIACSEPSREEISKVFDRADVLMVSGGNTLYAVDRWIKFGVHEAIRAAMLRGVVLAGGSAGAICWFDSGHSDSMDPSTYLVPRPVTSAWEYIRVDGLGLLPGLVCPHHDRIQSNGIKRSVDFDGMLLRHKGERGICIEHFAALIIEGETFRVMSFNGDARVFTKDVGEDGTIIVKELPSEGKVLDLVKPAKFIVKDPRVDLCRKENKC